MLGNIEGRRRRGRQRMWWLYGITDSMDMVRWTPGVGDGQGGLACCASWACKESDMTEWLNWTDQKVFFLGKKFKILSVTEYFAVWKHSCVICVSNIKKILLQFMSTPSEFNKQGSIYFWLRLPWWISSKVSTCNGEDAGNTGSISVLGRSPAEGNGNLL